MRTCVRACVCVNVCMCVASEDTIQQKASCCLALTMDAFTAATPYFTDKYFVNKRAENHETEFNYEKTRKGTLI